MAANGKRNVMANRVQTEYVGEARCRVYIIKMGGGILGLSLDTMMQQSRPKTTMAIEHCYQDTINGPINTKRAAFLFCGF